MVGHAQLHRYPLVIARQESGGLDAPKDFIEQRRFVYLRKNYIVVAIKLHPQRIQVLLRSRNNNAVARQLYQGAPPLRTQKSILQIMRRR